MYYSDKVKKAALIAYNAHKDTFDKGGYPYIMHPLHIAEKMDTEEEVITALLHDVVEDTSITFEELEKEGFSEEIINNIKTLTRNKNEDYMDYILRIKKAGNTALKVKIADMEHNMLSERLSGKTSVDEKRLEKYKNAFALLTNSEK